MTRRLLLVGSGAFARETLEIVNAINRQAPTWEIAGLLDDDAGTHGRLVHGVPVIGPSQAVADAPDALVVAGVASPRNPAVRLSVVERLALPDERYATLVHPAAVVPDSVTVGPGSIVHAGAVFTADIALGAHVAVMPAVVLTHDDVVEDGVTFGAGARVAGRVTIGRAAYIGSGALIRENLTVGAASLIGMGAVVTRSVPPGETWAGVPARRR